MLFDIEKYEKELEMITLNVISEFRALFQNKEIDVQCSRITRNGEITEGNYTSEIEIVFNTKGKKDYLDVHDQILVLHNKKNLDTNSYYSLLKKEFERILINPGGDWE